MKMEYQGSKPKVHAGGFSWKPGVPRDIDFDGLPARSKAQLTEAGVVSIEKKDSASKGRP